MRTWIVAGLLCGLAGVGSSYAEDSSKSDDIGLGEMTQPQYTETGQLKLPEGFQTWVFVGASLGLDYSSKDKPEGPGRFHHVYIQPEAYKHFSRTGEFPEKTMLIMENYSAGSKEENTAKDLTAHKKDMPILHGHFEDTRVGLEVALKDSGRFEDRWAYFIFGLRDQLRESAAPFPKAACWQCHNDHAARDNVFLQFYPILREALAEAETRGAPSDVESR